MYFAFSTVPTRLFLKITVAGYWDAKIWADYEPAARAAVASLATRGGCRAMLIDASGYPTQSREIADAHQKLLATTRRTRPTRIAILTSGALSRLQAKRVFELADGHVFVREEEALAWLFEAGGPSVSPPA
jgi:hypothetical protein